MMSRSILETLKDETAKLHQDVERIDVMSKLLSPDLTDTHYLQALYRLYRFVGTCEPTLRHHFNDADADYYYYPRLDTLRRDIGALSGEEPLVENQPLYVCAYTAIGMAYVIEGSTGGGKVLAKRLERQLGLSKGRGLSYFNFHRRGTWSLFTSWLANTEMTNDQQSLCVEGAKQCFELLLTANHERGVSAWRNNLVMT